MEFLVPRIPVHLLFGYISVVVTCGLLVLVLATPRRQASPSFIALAATMALWQFAKLMKNGGVPIFPVEDRDFWSLLSFIGATFVYPSLFSLSVQLSGRRIRKWRWPVLASIVSAVVMIVLFQKGVLTEGLRLEQYGYFNKPRPPYLSYIFFYVGYMVWGIVLLSRKPPEHHAIQYPSRILFWAASLGFGFGSLEFYSIMVSPIYPLADLSSAFYSAVFYWAIFRFNYMGGRALLRWIGLRLLVFLFAFALLYLSILSSMTLAPWFEHEWIPAILIALFLSSLVPFAYSLFQKLRQNLFPVQHSGRDLLLDISSLASSSATALDMAEKALATIQARFSYADATLILFQTHRPNENPPHLITRGIPLAPDRIPLLDRHYEGAISRREVLDSIRQLRVQGRMRRNLLRDYRTLRRTDSDVLVPASSEEGLELILLVREGRYRTEDWAVTAPLLEGVCKILADHLYLRRMNETRVQERHLGDLGLMAAGLAHEIKNPLEGIFGAAQILQEEGKANPKFVDMVLKDSMRLNDIVHSFLKFARPWPVQIQSQPLAALLQSFHEQQQVHGVSLEILGNTALNVQGDPGGIHQILLNLVQNAIRVQPSELPIRIRIHEQPQAIELWVEDDGLGIPEDQKPHLFKPFFSTAAKGNGLGLATSRKIAQAMQGDLFLVPSTHGAIFALKLKKVK